MADYYYVEAKVLVLAQDGPEAVKFVQARLEQEALLQKPQSTPVAEVLEQNVRRAKTVETGLQRTDLARRYTAPQYPK